MDSHCNDEEATGAVDTQRSYYTGIREGSLEELSPVGFHGPGGVAGQALQAEEPARRRARRDEALGEQRKFEVQSGVSRAEMSRRRSASLEARSGFARAPLGEGWRWGTPRRHLAVARGTAGGRAGADRGEAVLAWAGRAGQSAGPVLEQKSGGP